MTAELLQDGYWSDNPVEEIPKPPTKQPRAYQIEMFEHSLRENVIVSMETGSGKSLIGQLRIEAELSRNPDKITWMTTPTVALARQQHGNLKSQLPAYAFKLITGDDNPEYWSSKSVWNKALFNINGVVSTPQILLDALQHGFVFMASISLLVIDEAHRCVAKSPTNTMMQHFYFPTLTSGDITSVPHILGLTASPIIRDRLSMLETLEKNLNAVCKSPTMQAEEYRAFVHQPVLVRLSYNSDFATTSILVSHLNSIIDTYNINHDPGFLRTKDDQTLLGMQKFEKMLKKEETPILKQIKSLYRHAVDMLTSLGTWATDCYVNACINALHDMVHQQRESMWTLDGSEHEYMYSILDPVRVSATQAINGPPRQHQTSHKALTLIQYLESELREGMSCIIFVERRSTAFGLSSLLSSHTKFQQHRPFPYVGLVNVKGQSLRDLAEKRKQEEAFEEFKAGQRLICVASPAVEEGIDVQSCNLAVRFDQPATFRSFVQSRGRARHPNSKYVILHDDEDPLAKYNEWKEIEREMKELYAQQNRALAEYEAVEDRDEQCGRLLRVRSTGATLTIDNARQHLQHFCTTLPRGDYGQVREPVYIMSGGLGEPRSCKVILPSSMSPLFQTTNSLTNWRTEKMAKKDAAFEAYKRLYHVGLVNDHLLPHAKQKDTIDTIIEKRDGICDVGSQFDPWKHIEKAFEEQGSMYAYRINISGSDEAFPTLIMLLSVSLRFVHECKLQVHTNKTYVAKVIPIGCRPNVPKQLCQQITEFLFQSVLGRRLSGFRASGKKIPYLLIPDLEAKKLEDWFIRSQRAIALTQVQFNDDLFHQKYLLVRQNEQIPYLFRPLFHKSQCLRYQNEDNVEATRLTRAIDFLSNTVHFEAPKSRVFDAHGCSILNLSAGYGEVMLYMPSIIHYVELALRAQAACHGPLESVGYQRLDLIISAFTSAAAGVHNYQRLEYIGDALLKFHTSVNMFCNNPLAPATQLSDMRSLVVNNARLQRAACNTGLDTYITASAFSAPKWTPEVKAREPTGRQMASKVLADVVEALLGAAHEDGNGEGEKEDKVLAALNLFFPEIKWNVPSAAVHSYNLQNTTVSDPLQKLTAVEQMIGYAFAERSILAEAMTHSTLQPGMQSYERLEFLGDAIIDLIVKRILYQSPLLLDEAAMTRRQACLLNLHIFAFILTTLTTKTDHYSVHVPCSSKMPEFETYTHIAYLNDYVVRIGDTNTKVQRTTFLKNFTEVQSAISTALETGNTYPWCDLFHLDTPKSYSDILESIIGAVYIDSNGSLAACEHVLTHIGYLKNVHRFANTTEIDFKQPLVHIRELRPGAVVKTRRCGSAKQENAYWQARIEINVKSEVENNEPEAAIPVEAQLSTKEAANGEAIMELDNPASAPSSPNSTSNCRPIISPITKAMREINDYDNEGDNGNRNQNLDSRGGDGVGAAAIDRGSCGVDHPANTNANANTTTSQTLHSNGVTTHTEKLILGESLEHSSCRVEAENRAALDALKKLGFHLGMPRKEEI